MLAQLKRGKEKPEVILETTSEGRSREIVVDKLKISKHTIEKDKEIFAESAKFPIDIWLWVSSK